MTRARRSVAFATSVILTCALAASGGSVAATASSQQSATNAATPAPATTALANRQAARETTRAKYRVKPGVTFNSAVGGVAARRAIISKINATIGRTRKGETIRIFSWKIWTRAGVTGLLKAQRRGVRVQALMDKKNTVVESNHHFWRLRKGLRAGNKNRRPDRRSGARLCDHSCRGKGGAAHSKFFLFSKVGASRYVYMNSSANWGDAAANLQWNDMYTFVGDRGVYEAAADVFKQAWTDKPLARPWFEYSNRSGTLVTAWSPTTPKSRKADRLLNTLKVVKCRGATGGAGNKNRRTVIRSAPDVIRGERGMAVAQQLRRLWNNGCDVKIGYTVMGIDVNRLLRSPRGRGPVPIKQLTQDFDGDGIFDRYFHLKVYTVNGVIGKDTSAQWMVSGSSNTSGLSLVSDEAFVYFINRPGITARYQRHIDYWFDHFPKSDKTSRVVARQIASGEVDPYAKMELD